MLQALLLTVGGGGGMESDGSSDDDAGVAEGCGSSDDDGVLPKAKAPTARRCLVMLPRAKAPINRSAWKATVHQGRARVSRRGAWPSTFS